MYGLIFDIVKDLVLTQHGEETWVKLATASEVPVEFHNADQLPFERFMCLVNNVAGALSKTSDEVLEIAGVWFIVWLKKSEYTSIMEMAGSTLGDILQNVNMLHANMQQSFFQDMKPPQFFTTNVTPTSLRLHYAPGTDVREGLGPVVVGIIKGLVEHWFVDMNVKKLKIEQEKFRSKGAPFDVFHVNWKRCIAFKQLGVEFETTPLTVGLDAQSLNTAFPFHVVLDKNLDVVQVGHSLSKISKARVGDPFFQLFKVTAPPGVKKTLKDVIKLRHEVWVVHYVSTMPGHRTVMLRYQMIVVDRHLVFVGSPVFKDLQHAAQYGINMRDFPLHDVSAQTLFARSSTEHNEKIRYRGYTGSASDLSDEDLSERTGGSAGGGGGCPFTSAAYRRTSAEGSLFRRASDSAASLAGEVLRSEGLASTSSPALNRSRSGPAPRRASPPSPPSGSVAVSGPKPRQVERLMLKDAREDSFALTLSIGQALLPQPELFEEFVLASCALFERNNVMSDFLNLLVDREKKATDAAQMFRQDTLNSSIVMVYLRNIGVAAVRPSIRSVIGDVKRALGQGKGPLGDEARRTLAKSFLTSISTSAPLWPSSVRLLFRSITRAVPEIGRIPVVSLVFLRFVCPAIIFPEKLLITTEDTSAERKELVAVSKIIQTIAADNHVSGEDLQAKQSIFMFLDDLLDLDGFVLACMEEEQPTSVCATSSLRSTLVKAIDRLWEAASSDPTLGTGLKHIVKSFVSS